MPAAVFVVTRAMAATPFAPSAEPALNPNQPNQSRPAPSTVIGTSVRLGRRLDEPGPAADEERGDER